MHHAAEVWHAHGGPRQLRQLLHSLPFALRNASLLPNRHPSSSGCFHWLACRLLLCRTPMPQNVCAGSYVGAASPGSYVGAASPAGFQMYTMHPAVGSVTALFDKQRQWWLVAWWLQWAETADECTTQPSRAHYPVPQHAGLCFDTSFLGFWGKNLLCPHNLVSMPPADEFGCARIVDKLGPDTRFLRLLFISSRSDGFLLVVSGAL